MLGRVLSSELDPLPQNAMNALDQALTKLYTKNATNRGDPTSDQLINNTTPTNKSITEAPIRKENPINVKKGRMCDIDLEGGVCLSNNRNEENKYSHQNGLVGYFDFNHQIVLRYLTRL